MTTNSHSQVPLSPEREAAIGRLLSYSNAWADLVCSGIDPDEAHGILAAAAVRPQPVDRGCMHLLVTRTADGRYSVERG